MSGVAACVRDGPTPADRASGAYRPRHPERTVLYGVVQYHFESWLDRHREAAPDEDPIPFPFIRRGIACDNSPRDPTPTLKPSSASVVDDKRRGKGWLEFLYFNANGITFVFKDRPSAADLGRIQSWIDEIAGSGSDIGWTYNYIFR